MKFSEFSENLPALSEKERLRVDRKVSMLHDVITQSIQKETSLFAETVLNWFASHTKALQAIFWQADSTGQQIKFSAGFACTPSTISKSTLSGKADSPYREVISKQEVIYHTDLKGVFHSTSTCQVPLQSWLVLPLSVNGQLKAVIEFFHPQGLNKEALHLLRESLMPVAAAWSGVIEQESRKHLIDELETQTAKLHQQNEEIKAKGEELKQQAEELTAINDNLEKTYADLAQKNEQLAESKQSVEEKNKAIMSSIQYAQRIQKAMLPSQTTLKKLIGEHMLLFLPRDVVSGDFYWVNKSKQGVWLVVADCTGHGVPAALLGMMGINLLEHITQTRKELTPADLLTYLNKRVRETLRQEETDNQDGMDMSVCLFDYEKETIHFSGAKNAGYYFTKNGLEKLPEDRLAIGGRKLKRMKKEKFTNHKVKMSGDGMLFLCSDGFQDQFGGTNRRKFFRKNFLRLLDNIWQLPPKEQKQKLNMALNQWKGDNPQTDDVSVMGVRI